MLRFTHHLNVLVLQQNFFTTKTLQTISAKLFCIPIFYVIAYKSIKILNIDTMRLITICYRQ